MQDFLKIFDRLTPVNGYNTDNDLNALTLCASRTTPLKARREPILVPEFDAALHALEHATPPTATDE